ncbi:MAG TPA: response regulator [Anaeromyxobacteraceae bacterium]|nr:response regulator [Anaeromyxobacteraceae bacterium]
MDDEPRMGKAMERLLAPRYEVTVAVSGRQALALLEGGTEVDAIVCDLMMPVMTGIEMYEVLRAQRPGLAARVVFMTGGAYTDEAQEFLAQSPQRRLNKPFRPDELEQAIRSVIGG